MSNTSKPKTKSNSYAELSGMAKCIVELAEHLTDLSHVQYLTIDREWIGARYTDETWEALLKYRSVAD